MKITGFLPPKQSITKYHGKHENLGQKPGASPCLVFLDTHTFVLEKMGLLTHIVFCYSGPYLEAVQTFSVTSR